LQIIRMTTWPEARWLSAVEDAGLTRLRAWRAAVKSSGDAGTLAMLVRAPDTREGGATDTTSGGNEIARARA
jgi:hypothetical protein